MTGETAALAPVALVERQLQLVDHAHTESSRPRMANNATVQGRAIAFAVPGRYTVKATLDGNNLVEKVEAVLSNAVVGDMPMEVVYADYRDFGGVKFRRGSVRPAAVFPRWT